MSAATIGIVVAAGSATRMGEPKALMPIGERPMLQWVVDAAEASSLSRVVVVTGHAEAAIRGGIQLNRAEWAHNPDPGRGTMSSLRAGLEAAGPAEAVVKLVSDQPEIRTSVIDALLLAWDPGQYDAALVSYVDGDGHPLLVATDVVAELADGDRLLWHLIEERPDRIMRVTSNQTRPVDVNTPEDYRAVIDRLSGRP
ncbi:MAG: nucleotidyltransferase family protein [Acidimicrobiia bacterium]|nr:nucleotidyltransferase family protein [Acidimicrobiia bacterium]